MGLQAITAAVLAITVALMFPLAFGGTEERTADASAARQVALNWTGAELADEPRWDGDHWEVDVRRADGSVVEVTLDGGLKLLEIDEELGVGHSPAHDEVTGALRERAVAVAHTESGPGEPRSVERERDGTIEVDIVRPDRSVIEVELNRQLRVKDVDVEEFGDE